MSPSTASLRAVSLVAEPVALPVTASSSGTEEESFGAVTSGTVAAGTMTAAEGSMLRSVATADWATAGVSAAASATGVSATAAVGVDTDSPAPGVGDSVDGTGSVGWGTAEISEDAEDDGTALASSGEGFASGVGSSAAARVAPQTTSRRTSTTNRAWMPWRRRRLIPTHAPSTETTAPRAPGCPSRVRKRRDGVTCAQAILRQRNPALRQTCEGLPGPISRNRTGCFRRPQP